MMNFDAPDRYYCAVKRHKTATPLQSLVLMNDPQYLEASRMLAERMILEGGTEVSDRIDFAFKALISRSPRKEELSILQNLYEEELQHFRRNPKRTSQILSVGEYPVNRSLNQAEVATYGVLASTIMNFDEFVMKR